MKNLKSSWAARRPIPSGTEAGPSAITMPMAQCAYARSPLAARLFYKLARFSHWFLRRIGKRRAANMLMMSLFNMPFRGIARMTGGHINMAMLDGILMMVNGFFFQGSVKTA